MAVQPLSPATDRRLGRPLPHQLSNQTRAHPSAPQFWYFYHAVKIRYTVLAVRFQTLSRSEGQVAHALLTRPPLSHIRFHSEEIIRQASFDLHVLGTPPAFVLSQDQTLKTIVLIRSPKRTL